MAGSTVVKPSNPRLRRGRDTAGIYGAWPLAHRTSPARDYAGGNPLTFNGTVSWATGPDGPAVSLPGNASSYLQTATTVFNPLTFDLTAMLWFNAAATGTQQTLCQQLDGTGTGRNWLFLTTTKQLATSIGGVNTVSATNLVTAGNWYHAAVTTQGPSITLYLNGVPVATGSHAAEDNVAELKFGVSKTGGNIFTGLFGMSGIELYTRALSATEVFRRFAQPYRIWTPRRRWPPLSVQPAAGAAFHTWYIGRGAALGGGSL